MVVLFAVLLFDVVSLVLVLIVSVGTEATAAAAAAAASVFASVNPGVSAIVS